MFSGHKKEYDIWSIIDNYKTFNMYICLARQTDSPTNRIRDAGWVILRKIKCLSWKAFKNILFLKFSEKKDEHFAL